MIQGLFDGGAMPTIERMIQFTGKRHGLLTDSIANLSTPFYKPHDLDTAKFQNQLDRAIQKRRKGLNPTTAPLEFSHTRQVRINKDGLEVRPKQTNDNILFHDQNNRDLNRLMSQLAENTLAHNASIELARNQVGMLDTAIRERL